MTELRLTCRAYYNVMALSEVLIFIGCNEYVDGLCNMGGLCCYSLHCAMILPSLERRVYYATKIKINGIKL